MGVAVHMKKSFEFLGVEITQMKEEIKMTQTKLIEKIAEKFEITGKKKVKTPITEVLENNGEKVDFQYRSAVGACMYLATHTRPDISYALKEASKFLEDPKESCVDSIKRTIGYLVSTKQAGITMQKMQNYNPKLASTYVEAYADANFATCNTRKSTTGNLIMFCHAPILWRSISQRLVSTSTCEAELISLAYLTRECRYMRYLLRDLFDAELGAVNVNTNNPKHEENGETSNKGENPITMRCDNQSAIKAAHGDTARTKHLDIRNKYISDAIINNFVNLFYVNTNDNLSDMLTKPCSSMQLNKICDLSTTVHLD